MKYHFIYPDIGTGYYPSVHHGLAQLSSVLTDIGQSVSLHHVKKEPRRDDIWRVIDAEKPDIVGFTVMSNQLGYVKTWSRWIKEKYDIPIVCGGVHATLCPDELLGLDSVDMVCVGEGEKSIVEGDLFDGFWRFWGKRNGKIVKSTPYPLIDNLDELPFPDYSLFDIDGMMKARNGNFAVICSRGCPHNCSYCCNHALREKQKGLGKYFRYRSVDNTLRMLEEFAGKYPVKNFSFADDIFGINKSWVLEFCDKYPAKIGIPFECNLRVELATVEILEALKSANCVRVEMGIESGNEWMRREVLNRKMSNQQIVDAFDTAHRLGIKTRSYNMVGLPYETPDMVRETIELNKKADPDQIAVFYFYPYPGTKLYDVCEQEGLLSNKHATGYVSESILNLPTITPGELEKLYNEFYRLLIDKEVQSYGRILSGIFMVAVILLKWLTKGNEAKAVRNIYMRLFPVLQRMRRS